MMRMAKIITTTLLFLAAMPAMAATMPAPENPATGIWIQQVGDIVPHPSTKATLYYTKYAENDRVKSISYLYNGAGYLLMKPSDKKTLCTSGDGLAGADGIVHHSDGDLLIAGQGVNIHKVSKTAKENGGKCLVKTAKNKQSTDGFWHLMMDPKKDYLWAAGIPGYPFRFSTAMDPAQNSLENLGYRVYIDKRASSATDRLPSSKLSTIVWDNEGTAFFTKSEYHGGGCETSTSGNVCTESERKAARADAYFGVFTDTTYTEVTKDNQAEIGGKIGEKVITRVGAKILIDSLEGAHGAAYDTYSKTIFVFGGARIVQIQPYREGGELKAKVVAYIDLREFFFQETSENLTGPRTPNVGWRLDQGTTDGYGHLFVASNTGHMVFVDYAANDNKLIDANVLVHVQWVDNYLDDLAPLSGVGVIRDGANGGTDVELSSSAASSSSLVVWSSSSNSSSSTKSSSSVASSSSNGTSSSEKGSSSSGSNPSSSSTPGNSSSSNGGDPSSSSSNGGTPGNSSSSNGSDPSSSSNNGSNPGESSSSNGGDPSSSDDSNPSSSSSNGGTPGNSSGSNEGGNPSGSSSSGNSVRSSSSYFYFGAVDEDYDDDNGDEGGYASPEALSRGDSLVKEAMILRPTNPDASNPNVIEINGNSYLVNGTPEGLPMDFTYDSGLDTAKVGQVVAITLDSDKLKEFFKDPDSIKIVSETGILIVDPKDGSKNPSLKIDADGNLTILVTADQVVSGGSIKIYGNGQMVIVDNINFYDPIPNTRVAYIKDSDGNNDLDYMEIILTDTLSKVYDLDSVWLVVGGDSLVCSKFKMNETRDRVVVDVASLDLPEAGKFPENAKVVVAYSDKAGTGAKYYRSADVIEVGSNVIKDAYAIRSKNGMDSLFLQFNIPLIPADVRPPELLVMIKQEAERHGFDLDQIKKVYMPTKDIVILVAKSFDLQGDLKDSVSLYPGKVFDNLEYITSDEYEREVPVTVVDRFPSAEKVEYWDTNGDGTLDQIVTVFDHKLTAEDIDSTLFMTFPWYSDGNKIIQLQAQPADLRIDPKDSTRVIWDVHATTRLASGLTSISEHLPAATIYTYYSIFGETFVNEENAPLVDRMAPVVSRATLSYGSKADTLTVVFSEPIKSGLSGNDFFSYIHGDETIELNPTRLDWSADGMTATLVLNGGETTILPGDSLLVKHGSKDAIKDNYGNVTVERPQPVIIGGLLNHLVESTVMGTFDANDDRVVDVDDDKSYTLQTVSSVNLRYVPGTTTKEDMEKEGALGQLVQLGERFVPQLLDRAQVAADGTYDPSVLDSLKPEDVYISFIVNYFDHLGQYVNDTIITVPCNSPKFGGNCLETDKKVFVNWNFKDHNGRFVGAGVYNVQFKMIVKYEDKKIQEEIKDKWGVRRKKKHKK